MFTESNYAQGFLIDQEWMAGIHVVENGYLAYVVDIHSGAQLGAHLYPKLPDAIEAFQRFERNWVFESTSGCSGGQCGTQGGSKICELSGGACNNCGACSH